MSGGLRRHSVVHSDSWRHGVEVGLVADVEVLASVRDLVFDARLEVSDSHLVEGRKRRELLESYITFDGGEAVRVSILLHAAEKHVVLHSVLL